jgi:hypothetical protein
MAVQVLAVRLDGGDDLFSIVELIYRDDDDGKVGSMDRESLAEWLNDNPSTRFYVRDHLGDNKAVVTFVYEENRFLRIGELSSRDPLLRLPRFITPTKRSDPAAASLAKKTIDPISALWTWWLPRGW